MNPVTSPTAKVSRVIPTDTCMSVSFGVEKGIITAPEGDKAIPAASVKKIRVISL
jgi:hypothetical protein